MPWQTSTARFLRSVGNKARTASWKATTTETKFQDEIWPYSDQYRWIASEGHRFPPPSFGAPTLIWHFGLWKRQIAEAEQERLDEKSYQSLNLFAANRANSVENFDKKNIEFFDEVSEFLKSLQQRGGVAGEPAGFKYRTPELRAFGRGEVEPYRFRVCDPQSLTFTLWWPDDAPATRARAGTGTPQPADLRVRVHAQTHLDHATISFFIDVGKPWRAPEVLSSVEAVGQRRKALFERVELIRSVCDQQIRTGQVDQERLPERGIASDETSRLKEAAEYFYLGIWRDFIRTFASRPEGETSVFGPNSLGEVFADYRGVVLSVDGTPTPHDRIRRDLAQQVRAPYGLGATGRQEQDATLGFGRFKTFDSECGEPNTVLKAYWPFIRRMAPNADERDHVACGILDWRALFVSAQGSAAQGGDSGETSEPTPHLPQGWFSDDEQADTDRDRSRPVRYLLLSKGEPHRQQIGRFVERINALGTMRLFALKDLETIRNASVHIRILGHELDGILAEWSQHKLDIAMKWDAELLALGSAIRLRNMMFWRQQPGEDPKTLSINEKRAEDLNRLIGLTDARLISLGAALDRIGQGGSGRLLYIINRSRHFIAEFERMAATLEVGNIDTWVHYLQFVERGLKPTFDMIDKTATRLIGLRERLQSITQMIQTSALIVESVATQSNTAALRNIASRWTRTNLLLIAVTIALAQAWRIIHLEDLLPYVASGVQWTWRTILPFVFQHH